MLVPFTFSIMIGVLPSISNSTLLVPEIEVTPTLAEVPVNEKERPVAGQVNSRVAGFTRPRNLIAWEVPKMAKAEIRVDTRAILKGFGISRSRSFGWAVDFSKREQTDIYLCWYACNLCHSFQRYRWTHRLDGNKSLASY
jgi:hypothetical protein